MGYRRPQLELTIDTIAQGGDGIGRHEGKVVFVPFVLPGERVRVEIVMPGRQFDRAALVEVLEPAPERVVAPCAVYARCGGCRFQHTDIATEHRLKERLLADLCERIPGCTATVEPIVPSPREWHYRNRVQVHIARGRIGFRVLRSRNVVPVSECLLADERLLPLFPVLQRPAIIDVLSRESDVHRLELRVGQSADEILAVVDDVAMRAEPRAALAAALGEAAGRSVPVVSTEAPDAGVSCDAGGGTLRVTGGGFVQANAGLNPHLVAAVRASLLAEGPAETLVDLYCGAGNFTLPLAADYPTVIGIDVPRAVADARRNAAQWERDYVDFVEADLTSAPEAVLAQWVPPDAAVILDPPRGGARELVAPLAARRPRAIAYVSCDPPAFARDAALLHQAGYVLTRVQPFNMFPRTAHLELIGVFRRGS